MLSRCSSDCLISLLWKLLPLSVNFHVSLCVFYRVTPSLFLFTLLHACNQTEVFANGHVLFSEFGYHVAFLLLSLLLYYPKSFYLSSVAQMPSTSLDISVKKSPCCFLEPTIPSCQNDLQLCLLHLSPVENFLLLIDSDIVLLDVFAI